MHLVLNPARWPVDPLWWPIAGAVVAFLGAVLLTPLVVWGARRMNWVARPQADRWHEEPTALMGGVAIYAAATLALLLTVSVLNLAFPWALWTGATLMFAAGLADDRYGISPAAKLIVQVGATLLLLYAGYAFGPVSQYWLSIPLTFLWVIGITNAVNLLDNMDGLAAGIAAIAAAVLGIYALFVGGQMGAAALWVVAGAASGFLVFNFKPARIFMGDCGSLFLGYVIAAFTIVVQSRIDATGGPAAYLVSAAVLAVPIFDTTLVTIGRALSGRAVSQGGRDHSSHRLVFLGLSERRAVTTLYAVSVAFGALALAFHFAEVTLFYALTAFFAVGLAVFGVHLSSADVYRRTSRMAPAFSGDGAPAENGNGHAENGHAETEEAPRSLWQRTTAQKGSAVMRAFMGHNWKSGVQVAADLLLIAAAFVLAHYLRFEGGLSPAREAFLMHTLPGVVGLKLAVFFGACLYQGLWEHAGTPELVRIVKASSIASGLCYGVLAFFYGSAFLSEATFIIDWMILTLAVVGVRFAFRGFRQYLSSKREAGRRVLLYGAGSAGQLTLRGLRQNPDFEMVPVGFLDDDPAKRGLTAQGLAVLGTFQHLERICHEHHVEEVLITAFRMGTGRKQEILHRCEEIGVACRLFSLALRPVLEADEPPQQKVPLPKPHVASP